MSTNKRAAAKRQTSLQPLAPLDLNQRYTVAESLRYLRISRRFFATLVEREKIPVIREGSRVFVPGSVIAARSRVDAAA